MSPCSLKWIGELITQMQMTQNNSLASQFSPFSHCSSTTMVSNSGETCHLCTSHYLVQACGGIILISRPTFMDIYPYFQDNTSFKFPSSTHTHTPTLNTHTHTHRHTHTHIHTHTNYIYISTYYYACQHKNMLHPPQEGSDRILPYGTLLDVLW